MRGHEMIYMEWYDLGIVLDDALAVKLCLIAPLLYLSLAMTIDPPRVIESLNRLHRQGQLTLRAQNAVRLTGICLMALIIYSAS